MIQNLTSLANAVSNATTTCCQWPSTPCMIYHEDIIGIPSKFENEVKDDLTFEITFASGHLVGLLGNISLILDSSLHRNTQYASINNYLLPQNLAAIQTSITSGITILESHLDYLLTLN